MKEQKQKNIFRVLIALMLCMFTVFSFAACVNTPDDKKEIYTVTFDTNGGSAVAAQKVEKGNKAVKPADPTKENYEFGGWYKGKDLINEWKFETDTVETDVTLYAGWTEKTPEPTPDPSKDELTEEQKAILALDYTEVKSSLSCYVNAMGGIEFGKSLLTKASYAENANGKKYLQLNFTKSEVTIYTVTCYTFVDTNPVDASGNLGSKAGVTNGTVGIYENSALVTDGVFTVLSNKDDTCQNPNGQQVRYVVTAVFPISEIKSEYRLSMFVNSQVMGCQFSEKSTDSTESAYPAILTLDIPDPNVVAATCTEDGYRITYDEQGNDIGHKTVSKAKGHIYDDSGVCTKCKHNAADDFTYEENESGTGYIIASYTGKVTPDVYIPDTYNGKPVVGIKDCVKTEREIFGKIFVTYDKTTGIFYGKTDIKSVRIPQTVTYIGDYAFAECKGLEKVVLPTGVELGIYVFSNDSSLSDINIEVLKVIPNYTFQQCTSLAGELDLSNATSVGQAAFQNTGITSIVFPTNITKENGATYLGIQAFSDCKKLASVNLPANIALNNQVFSSCSQLARFNSDEEGTFDLSAYTVINDSAFSGASVKKLIFSAQTTKIGGSAFMNCKALETVDFNGNNGSIEIGTQAFMNCSSVKSLILSDNTTTIGNSAFSGDTALQELYIGKVVTSIPSMMCKGCSSLVTFTLPDSVQKIGSSAFSECTALEKIEIDPLNSELTTIDGFTSCYALAEFTLPLSVTTISKNAFSNCRKLAEIINYSTLTLTIGDTTGNGGIAKFANVIVTPDNLTDIGKYIQSGDYKLYYDKVGGKLYLFEYTGTEAQLVLPDSFNVGGENVVSEYYIDDYAFYGNETLTSITVSASVKGIEQYAFASCENLTSLTFAAESNLNYISNYAFSSCKSLTSVKMPALVKKIGQYAFYRNYRLASVELNEGLEEIGASAFVSNYKLVSITVPSTVTKIGDKAFDGCVALVEVKNLSKDLAIVAGGTDNGKIAAYASNVYTDASDSIVVTKDDFVFALIPATDNQNASLILVKYNADKFNVQLPASVEINGTTYTSYAIGSYAFAYKNMTMVTIPAAVTKIGDYAFYNSAVRKVTLTDSGKTNEICDYAFSECANLTSFNSSVNGTIDLTGVTVVGEGAFYGVGNGITSLLFGSDLTSVGNSAFAYMSGLKNTTFAEKINGELDLGKNLFMRCSALEKIAIPSYITTIARGMFYDCTALKSILLHDGITEFAQESFRGTTSLEEIILPTSLISIGKNAFTECGVTTIILKDGVADISGITVDSTGNASFTKATVYVYSEEEPIIDGYYWHYGADNAVEIWTMVW